MNTGEFTLARQAVSGNLIERMFGREGSRWEGDEYRTLSPLRPDTRLGSFSIRRDGCWYDFATGDGGDFIDLVRRAKSCPPLEAARHILREAGSRVHPRLVEERQADRRPCAALPAAEETSCLGDACDNELTRRRYGRRVGVWPYCGADGKALFYVCRYESADARKSVIPWHSDERGIWHLGQPLDSGRPLFRLPELLRSSLPVLVVEGEKCATVTVPAGFPFLISTWSGGARATERTDWTPLKDREVVIWPDADQPGREAALRIRAQLPRARVLRVEGKPTGWDIADAVAESIDAEAFIRGCPTEAEDGAAEPVHGMDLPRLVTRRALDIPTRPVEWLWEGRIPLGEYSVLVGHPSSGKSTFAAALAAHVSAGIPFPDGTKPVVGDVLFMSAEESAAKVLVPRLRVAGAALDRVSIADIRLKRTDRVELFTLADGTDPIEAALEEMDSPRLIIIDSLTSCTSGIDTFRTDAFGPILAELAQLSERRNVTTLCLAHFTKAVSNGAMLRVLGSVAVVALARAVYMLARHPDNPKRSLFVPVKNSYAPLGEAIEFSLISTDAGKLPQIRWGRQVEGVEADSLIALDDVDRRRERSDAMELLAEILCVSDGVLAHEVYTIGAERGLSKTTIWRAARDRKVVIEGKGRAARWKLPIVADEQESFPGRMYTGETNMSERETIAQEVEVQDGGLVLKH